MRKLFESVYDVEAGAGVIQRRRYGVIEVAAGRLVGIHFRPWPKIISTTEANWLGGWQHGRRRRDQCLLYYNQPAGHPNFLALKYVVTSFGTSLQTGLKAMAVLDRIACHKKTDAIVAEVTNSRISDRVLQRLGWEQHLLDSGKRQFIKRFYGQYPTGSQTKSASAKANIVP